jgi:hypothetical protein
VVENSLNELTKPYSDGILNRLSNYGQFILTLQIISRIEEIH